MSRERHQPNSWDDLGLPLCAILCRKKKNCALLLAADLFVSFSLLCIFLSLSLLKQPPSRLPLQNKQNTPICVSFLVLLDVLLPLCNPCATRLLSRRSVDHLSLSGPTQIFNYYYFESTACITTTHKYGAWAFNPRNDQSCFVPN